MNSLLDFQVHKMLCEDSIHSLELGGCSGSQGGAAAGVQYHSLQAVGLALWQILHSINKHLMSAKPLGDKKIQRFQVT